MADQGPGESRRLIGKRHRHYVHMLACQQSIEPPAQWVFQIHSVTNDRAGAMHVDQMLFDSDGLGEVAGLIDVGALEDGDMVSQ